MNKGVLVVALVVAGFSVDDLTITTSRTIDLIAERAQMVRHISLPPVAINERIRLIQDQ
tara:strand:- start:5219 stop:5395 length:177 start_codon:yes stop_codon:yes gene_type:complete